MIYLAQFRFETRLELIGGEFSYRDEACHAENIMNTLTEEVPKAYCGQ